MPDEAPDEAVEKTEAHAAAAFERPQPLPSRDSAFFWQGALRGELLAQRCSACHALRHPPRPMCPTCLSIEWEAIPLSGRGTVHAWIRPVHPRLPMFDEPLICVLVDLEEGLRLFSNLEGCSVEEVEVDLPVEVTFVPTRNQQSVPVFRPVERPIERPAGLPAGRPTRERRS